MDDKFIAPVSDQEDKGSFVAPSADIEGGAKKKSGNIIIEIGKWYFRINGKAIRLRSPITFERD